MYSETFGNGVNCRLTVTPGAARCGAEAGIPSLGTAHRPAATCAALNMVATEIIWVFGWRTAESEERHPEPVSENSDRGTMNRIIASPPIAVTQIRDGECLQANPLG